MLLQIIHSARCRTKLHQVQISMGVTYFRQTFRTEDKTHKASRFTEEYNNLEEHKINLIKSDVETVFALLVVKKITFRLRSGGKPLFLFSIKMKTPSKYVLHFSEYCCWF